MWKIGIFPDLRAIRNEVFHKSNMFFRLDYENSRPYKGFQLRNTSKIQDPTFWHLRTSCPHSAQCVTCEKLPDIAESELGQLNRNSFFCFFRSSNNIKWCTYPLVFRLQAKKRCPGQWFERLPLPFFHSLSCLFMDLGSCTILT